MDKYVDKYKNADGRTLYFISETSCCGKRVEWLRGESPEVCPYCGDNYYLKPNLENKLFNLQDLFIEDFNKTQSVKILGEQMFPLIQEYAMNIIKGLVKGKKSLAADELNVRAWDAATLLIEVIMKDPDHRMRFSFGKYLGDLCKSVCYSTKKHENTYSLNSLLQDKETELLDTITVNLGSTDNSEDSVERTVNIKNVTEALEFNEDIVNSIVSFIEKTAEALYSVNASYLDKMLYLLGLLLKFKPGKDANFTEFYNEAGQYIKQCVDKGELLVLKEMKFLIS